MRRIILTLGTIFIVASLQAQTVLKYQTHGLIPDYKNEMLITKYTDPGPAGKNVVWNFAGLELTKDFVGSLDKPDATKGENSFPSATTVLEEFGNYFFFRTTELGIEQLGYMSGSGKTTIVYDVPFQKIRYPFTFGDYFTGNFSGSYNSDGKSLGPIVGSYTVTGDGMGTLVLPGGVSYENALRVKENKSFTQTLNNTSYDVENITYRWYVNGHRFPILVLIQSSYKYKTGRTQVSTQAAYNPVILLGPTVADEIDVKFGMSVFPNPYRDQVTIRYNLENSSTVNLSVYDLNGRLVKVLVNNSETPGEKSHKFSAKEMGLAAGAYLVKLNVNGVETTQKILEL